jgi:3-hydroxy-D-aspartate aldolase
VAFISHRTSEVETPCLCLDLSKFEGNLSAIANLIRQSGKSWRPHTHCHACPEIALRQVRAGAPGVTCATITDAELFAAAGISDILLAHLPVGVDRIRRIVRLCKTTKMIVSCDHYVQASALSEECIRQGVKCRTLVDINVGMMRTGVRPGRDAIELARGIERLPGLELAGIMGYEGHANSLTDADQKREAIDSAIGILSHTRDVYRKNGLCCDIVSASGTGSFQRSICHESLTEVQAGGGIFGDPYYRRMPGVPDLEPALTILATVVSRPGFDRAVLDVGRSKFALAGPHFKILGWDDVNVVLFGADHTVLELGSSSRELRIGDYVELVVDHASSTTQLYDRLHVFREDRLESVWRLRRCGNLTS